VITATGEDALRSERPVSIKGVVSQGHRVVLLRNDQDEWELPGGRPEPGESERATLTREVREEIGLDVDVVERLDRWPYEVLPGRIVEIVAWGCVATSGATPRASHEHREVGLFELSDIAGLPLHHGYRRVIVQWMGRRGKSSLTNP
jgi:8-oxo-dGTP pyrophosphatase MutT (NUDIX family)